MAGDIKFSGLATGIDSAALIDSLIEAREITNNIRRAEIQQLEDANSALEDLNTKLIELSDLIDNFRTVNGGGISKLASSSASDVATAVAGSDAVNGSYGLTVTTLAEAGTASLENLARTYSDTSDTFADDDGTITIDVGQGADQVAIEVNVTGGSTTVQEVVDQINSDPDASGRVSATAVNVGTDAAPDYKILVNSLETGDDKGFIAISEGGTAQFQADITNTIDQSDNAEFDIAGLGTITRTSNTISDVIGGLTFQLQKAGDTTISVANDADSTADSMQEIVDKFNEIVTFINENDQVERVESGESVDNIFGSLASESIDNLFLSTFRSELLSAETMNGTEVTSLPTLGLLTNRDGTLDFDADEFKDGLNTDPIGSDEVLRDFADSVAGVGNMIDQYTRFQGFVEVAQGANDSEIESLNDAIDRQSRSNDSYREALERQFSRLEAISGQLQGQQAALTNILASL